MGFEIWTLDVIGFKQRKWTVWHGLWDLIQFTWWLNENGNETLLLMVLVPSMSIHRIIESTPVFFDEMMIPIPWNMGVSDSPFGRLFRGRNHWKPAQWSFASAGDQCKVYTEQSWIDDTGRHANRNLVDPGGSWWMGVILFMSGLYNPSYEPVMKLDDPPSRMFPPESTGWRPVVERWVAEQKWLSSMAYGR